MSEPTVAEVVDSFSSSGEEKAYSIEKQAKIASIKQQIIEADAKLKRLREELLKEEGQVVEPLLDPKNSRSIWFPLDPRFEPIFKFYRKHESANWVYTDVPYSKDKEDWAKASAEEKRVLSYVLAFFLQSDVLVNKKENRDLEEITVPEKIVFTTNKTERENTHTMTYMEHFNTLVTDEKQREELLNGVRGVPVIKDKADWLNRYTQEGTFAERTLATALTEGIFFSSSFAIIYLMKHLDKFPGLTFSNEYIARDEGIHRDEAIFEYRYCVANKLPKHKVIEMVRTATDLECRFVKEAIKVDMIGMNADLMCDYVKMCSDSILFGLIGERIYNIEINPFPWMKMISFDTKTNFFDKFVSSYAKSSMSDEHTEEDKNLVLDISCI